MRSLRDDEQQIGGPDGPGGVAGAPGPVTTQVGRSGVGAASLRWKPPIDHDEVRSVLAYLRACLSREAVHAHVVRPHDLDSDSCACLPPGPELLFSGARDTVPLQPAAARVLHLAQTRGQALRYGYPLVVLGQGDDRVALPLLTTDVRAVDELDGLPRELGPRPETGAAVRAVGPPDVNAALLARLGITDPDDLFELRTRLRTGAPDTVHRPAAVADLAVKVRTLLSRLEVERIDDIDPLGARGRPTAPANGAHNVAVLFRAGPGGQPDGDDHAPGSVEGVLADLDPSDRDGLDPEAAVSTALEPFLGRSANARPLHPDQGRPPTGRTARRPPAPVTREPQDTAAVVPVSAAPLNQSQYAVLSAAMRDQLTVAATPPGSGAHDLVDALVRTAVSNGQRVLLCARTEGDLAEITRRAAVAPGHPVVRVGGPEHRAAEIRQLNRLLIDHAGASPPPVPDTPDGEPASHREDLAHDWARVRQAWRAMDVMASGGHALARLAEERGRSIACGWDPDALFTPERGGPEYWLHRAERAGAGGFVGLQHRAAIRRELGVSTDPDSLARLCAVARMESEWRSAVDQRTRCAPLGELTSALADALAGHRRSSSACLRAATEPRLWRGRAAIENRLETLNWHHGTGWPGVSNLLDTLPTWMCRTDQVRALPPQAALYDLVIVVGAERTRAAEVLPALYRASRAVVLGDPAHPGPMSVLEPAEERRALAAAGMTADQLDDRGLRHGSGSALRAAYKAAPPLLWLDEHTGAAPPLAEAASRHCYGGRISVRTVPDPAGGPVFEWHDVPGTCEAAPGASYVNRDEAYRVAVVVDELDAELPPGQVIAVVAPTQPQVALIRRQLRHRDPRHDVRVGGPDLLDCDRDAADVTVLSPMLAAAAPAIAERRVLRMIHLWSSVLTRTRRRLVVVGDRGYWVGGDGPLAELDTLVSGARTVAGTDAARDALVDELRGAGTSVTLLQTVQGWTADLVVRFAARRLIILLDREPDGRALRHLVVRGEALNRVTGDPVVLVPAWRCLADPRALVEEILAAY
ncbi:DEAD/DEAH box helicase [Nocardiopsis sp. FIRDI 009]|uniref:DEAD/DEAH box helicase n=1 Tax=Nocardiopsis sp. FIRDI 009 TaxID=714197 RepID=UPI000E24B317|nr:AAA domain-containing protein [Nocardiopsis sp. FIRDI 009]